MDPTLLKEACFEDEAFDRLIGIYETEDLILEFKEFEDLLVTQLDTSEGTDSKWYRAVRVILRRCRTRISELSNIAKAERAEQHAERMRKAAELSAEKTLRHAETMRDRNELEAWKNFSEEAVRLLELLRPGSSESLELPFGTLPVPLWLESRERRRNKTA